MEPFINYTEYTGEAIADCQSLLKHKKRIQYSCLVSLIFAMVLLSGYILVTCIFGVASTIIVLVVFLFIGILTTKCDRIKRLQVKIVPYRVRYKYIFNNDYFEIVDRSKLDKPSNARVSYNSIKKSYETLGYFYIFMKKEFYRIDKNTFTKGMFCDFRRFIKEKTSKRLKKQAKLQSQKQTKFNKKQKHLNNPVIKTCKKEKYFENPNLK